MKPKLKRTATGATPPGRLIRRANGMSFVVPKKPVRQGPPAEKTGGEK